MATTISPTEAPKLLEALILDSRDARKSVLSGQIDLRATPIPEISGSDATRYTGIPAAPTLVQSELVDLSEYGFGSCPDYYAREAKFNPVYNHVFPGATATVMLLKPLAERLAETNDALRARFGLELEPMNGFRPLSVQRGLFEDFYEAGRKKFEHTLKGDELYTAAMQHALTYASRPPQKVSLNDSTTWYAHGTGAAIDLLLRGAHGGPRLDFGVIFDDPDSRTHVRALEGVTLNSTASERAYQANRRTLFWTMAASGFVGYPEEFFHFDPFQVAGHTTQFAILNSQVWGIPGAQDMRATVPPAKEALTE